MNARVNQFTKDQQQLLRDIFHGLHSEEYAGRVMQQVEHDNGEKGFGGCSVALFGEPGNGKFEFVFTGRHVTRRCDGDSVEGAAFRPEVPIVAASLVNDAGGIGAATMAFELLDRAREPAS